MSLGKLVFDTTDSVSIEDSANVGAYLRSSDGTLITHSTVGGKEALDVSIADGLNVEVDLSHIDDSVRLGDGTSFFTSTSENSDISLDVHISNTNIEVTQGTSPWVIGDGGSSITVDAVQLDIDDLNATDDAVASWTHDGTGTAITSRAEDGGQALDVHITGSGDLTVNDSALAVTAMVHSQQAAAATNTAESTVDSILSDRKYLFLQNSGNKDIFIGGTGVTIATGFPISPGAYMELRAGAAIDVQWAAKNTAGSDLRALEIS